MFTRSPLSLHDKNRLIFGFDPSPCDLFRSQIIIIIIAFLYITNRYFTTRPELAETLQLAAPFSKSNQNAANSKKPISPSLPPSSLPSRPGFSKSPAVPRRVSSTIAAAADDVNGDDSPKVARSSPSPVSNQTHARTDPRTDGYRKLPIPPPFHYYLQVQSRPIKRIIFCCRQNRSCQAGI